MYVDQGWLSIAEAVNSPNSDPRSDEHAVSLLVIHNISLPPGQFGGGHINELFSNTLNAEKHPYFAKISNLKVSAHLLIDRHGYVTQFVPFNKIAWHAGVSTFEGLTNCNEYSIGIELEGTIGLVRSAEEYLLQSGFTKVEEQQYDIGMLLIKYK